MKRLEFYALMSKAPNLPRNLPRNLPPDLMARLDPPSEAAMRHLIGGAVRTQALYVAAKLGVADQLSLGARSADELAERVQAHASTLRRLLRFLVVCGVFVEQEDGRFALNRTAEYLQSGHPRSLRPSAIRAGEGMWNVAARLLETVTTGRTPHEDVHGTTFFERAGEREFGVRMSSSTAGLAEAFAANELVANAARVVDVGGGDGAVLIRLLQWNAQLRAVLFDRPAMIEAARVQVGNAGLGDRCELVAGDFFEGVPAGGDVYLLSWVLHDWDDEQALRILRACRQAGAQTLLIAETLLPARAVAAESAAAGLIADPYTLDLQMLLLTGGRERSEGEYRALLDEAGFARVTTAPAAGSPRGASIIEARR
jgi:hypothetical protein